MAKLTFLRITNLVNFKTQKFSNVVQKHYVVALYCGYIQIGSYFVNHFIDNDDINYPYCNYDIYIKSLISKSYQNWRQIFGNIWEYLYG